MNKTRLVMRHEFWRHLKRRSFLFAVLGLPTIMLVVIGGIVLFFTGKAQDPVGAVDQVGILMDPAAYRVLAEDTTPFLVLGDEKAARSALAQKEIQAYFVIPANYLDTGRVTLYHQGDVFEGIGGEVANYLRASLLADSDPVLLARFRDNALDLTFISLSEDGRSNSPMAFMLPFVIGFCFLIATFSTSGSLLQAIVDEKENRTMEILITSLKPSELMIGKIIGLVGLGFIQIAVWLGLVFMALAIVRANVPDFPTITVAPNLILIAIAWFAPYYVLVAALITAVGISITAVAEGQHIVGIINILSIFPIYFTGLILENPNSGLSLVLSLIPFSAPLTVLTRSQLMTVPVWQLAASWAILAGTAVLSLFLVSHLLRLGLLRYGKKLTVREAVGAIRQK